MTLARRLLNNEGFVALTVPEERKETINVGKRKIRFAFFQSNFEGGRIPYWHVIDPSSQSYMSTLSMEGLREWKII